MHAGAVVPPAHVARPFRLRAFRAVTLAATEVGNPAALRALVDRDELEQRRRRWDTDRDPVAAVYLHEYTVAGTTVRGLVGALDVARRASAPADVAVFPHEGIHLAQSAQLARRMRQMDANPAAILLVHRGPAPLRDLLDEAQRRPATRELVDHVGQRHRVWAIDDPTTLRRLEDLLAPTQAVIADGHHRYAAYLELQEEDPGGATDEGLAMLVDQDDTPLGLGAIHRVVGRTTLAALATAARQIGAEVVDLAPEGALDRIAPTTLVATDGRRWVAVDLVLPIGRLAVEALHADLLPALRPAAGRTSYHHTVGPAVAEVGHRRGVAILLPAPDLDEVLDVCAADRLLPEKATSFQPKPSVGVLIRPLHAG